MDISAATGKENDLVAMKVSSMDINDAGSVLGVFEALNNKIGDALKNDKWNQGFSLVDKDEIELEKLEEFTLCFEEIKENTVVALALQVI